MRTILNHIFTCDKRQNPVPRLIYYKSDEIDQPAS